MKKFHSGISEKRDNVAFCLTNAILDDIRHHPSYLPVQGPDTKKGKGGSEGGEFLRVRVKKVSENAIVCGWQWGNGRCYMLFCPPTHLCEKGLIIERNGKD